MLEKSQSEWLKTQVIISKLKSAWMPKEIWEERGMTPTEVTDDIQHFMSAYIVLDRAWRRPFSITSNFARTGAFHVALCASEGLISTNVGEDIWGTKWVTTEIGKETKGDLDELLSDLFARANGKYHNTH